MCKAYVQVKATQREIESGCSAVLVDEVFLFGEDSAILGESHIGKDVDYAYNRRGFLEFFKVSK